MESVGRDLRLIREKRGILLSEISQATRINITHLSNLEDGRYSDMPGGMYNRAFLRTYCEYLGLDPTEYLGRYEAETMPPSEKATKSKSKSTTHEDTSFRPHPLVAWGLMLLISVAGLYLSRRWIASVFSPYFSHSPVVSMPLPASTATKMPEPQQAVEPAADQVVTVSGAPQTNVTAPQPPSGTLPATKAAPPPPAPGMMRIEFHVIEECWVSVSSDGARVQKLLEPGEDQFFDAAERFYIILGNAGGVQLKINGRAAKPLGKSGEVVHMLINQQNLSELLERSTG